MQPRSCQEGERSRESACLQCGFTPLAGDPKTTKMDKKHGSRQESHPLSDGDYLLDATSRGKSVGILTSFQQFKK